MSLNAKYKLSQVAKIVSRDLRRQSTEAEKIFWEAVRNKKLLNRKFTRQHPILYDLNGSESFFIADFFCYEEKLIAEIDGFVHNFKLKEDTDRTDILNKLGLNVIRFKNEMIENNLNQVLEELKSYFSK